MKAMSNLEDNDNRHYHRIFYQADANLSCQEKNWPCKITDLSLKGCLLSFELPWTEDLEKIYTLNICLSDQVQITMGLSVAHVVGDHVGFKCEHIDIDSISELRRLVEFNIGNCALLERDLLALADTEPDAALYIRKDR